ncbi:MAG: DNA mismatch repair protein MutT [Chitinophagaceae bacterium]
MKWKILSSETILKDNWCTVRKDKCEKPDGTIVSHYYVYEFPTWATALAITEDNKAVLVKQYRHALEEISLETPGGVVEDGESFEKGIARELLEETGYEFSEFHYLGKTSPNPSTNNNWMHMFLATGGKKIAEQSLDQNEEIEVELYSIEELKQLVKENKIIQAMHVNCIVHGLLKMGEISF